MPDQLKLTLIQLEVPMKINSQTRFPHPVLNTETGDYKSGNFSIALLAEETPSNGTLKLNYKVMLDEPGLSKEVKEKSAVVGLFVNCPDTFYSNTTSLADLEGVVEFPSGTLRGRASVRPLIWAYREISNYTNDNLHEEYGETSWRFAVGALLAVGNELIINIGKEKLAPMESIFSLAFSPELAEGEIKVQVETDNITINSAQATYETINQLRGLKIGQSILLNSIYLPAVMEVLSNLKDNPTGFEDKKWFKVFNAKCEHLGIDYNKGSFLEDAQKLLKSPIGKIKTIGEQLL